MYTKALDMAAEMMGKKDRSELCVEFREFLLGICEKCESQGGYLRSRQTVALAVSMWELLQKETA